MIRLLLIAFCLLGLVRAEETTLADLVPGLSSDEFNERKGAMEKVEAYAKANPEKTLEEIIPLLKNSKDPEARARLIKVAEDLKVKKTRSLFGFTFFLLRTAVYQGNRVTGVSIRTVMPGTAASRDGLLPGDVILAVDGKSFPIDIEEDEARNIFAAQIPGKKVALKVQRQGELIEVQVSPTESEVDPLMMSDRLLDFQRWLEEELEK